MPVRRVPITFNRVLGWLGTLFGTGPSRSWIDIDDATGRAKAIRRVRERVAA